MTTMPGQHRKPPYQWTGTLSLREILRRMTSGDEPGEKLSKILQGNLAGQRADVAKVTAAVTTLQTRITREQGALAAEQQRLARLAQTGGSAQERVQIEREITRLNTLLTSLGEQLSRRQANLERQTQQEQGARQRIDFFKTVKLLMPDLPPDLAIIYTEAWAGNDANADVAFATMVANPRFEQYFPGLKRKDGTLRMTLAEYKGTIEGYEDALLHDARVNPALFRSQFAALIEGDVSADEFRSRVGAVVDRVVNQEDALKQVYVDYGFAMDTASLIASALDPTIGQAVLERRISIAEIGGEAALQGFAISRYRAERLLETGFGQQSSQELFRAAGQMMPALARASRRQREGNFNLTDFLESQAFGVADESKRLQRILGGEASMFTSERTDVARNQQGAVTGLASRSTSNLRRSKQRDVGRPTFPRD